MRASTRRTQGRFGPPVQDRSGNADPAAVSIDLGRLCSWGLVSAAWWGLVAPGQAATAALACAAAITAGFLVSRFAQRPLRPGTRRDDDATTVSRIEDLEHRLRRLVVATDGAMVGVWDFDLATDTLEWSDAMFALYGVERSETPCYEVWRRALHPADLDEAERRLQRAIAGDTSRFTTEFRVVLPSGEVRTINANATVERDEHGRAQRVVGINTDITHLREAEDRLRRNEARLEDAARMAGVGGWEVDLLANKPHWSRQVRAIHEVDDDYEPDLETAIDFYAPEARPVIRTAIERAIATGEPWEVELPMITAKGRRIWVRAIGRPEYCDGECVRLAGTFQEITAHRDAAEALRRSEERLAIAIDGTRDGFYDLDLLTGGGARDAWFTQRFRELTGMGATDGLEGFMRRVAPEDRFRLLAAAKRHMARGTPFDVELRVDAGGGLGRRWFRARGNARFDENGAAIRLAGSITDIQTQRNIEAELRRQRDRAAEASRSKSEFLANMSHEIRTPMTSILGFADLLEDGGIGRDEVERYVRTIQRNGQHLLSLINDILDLSKIEAGKVELQESTVAVRPIVEDVRALLSGRAEDQGIALRVDVRDEAPERIVADPVRLRQILVNLVGNAIKFTERGAVRLEVGRSAGDRIRFDVVDTGIGIAPEQLGRVFAAFEQADSSITRRFGGTGLGLPITRSLVDCMGGSISVDSTPSVGSRFTVQLPIGDPTTADEAHSPHTPTGDRPAPADRDSLRGRRILLAEDGRDNQLLIGHMLRKAGAEVEVAENGAEAIARVTAACGVPTAPAGAQRADAPFDLVLMDMQMPELDGLTATRHLREAGIDIPILALTANTMSGDRERCLAAGCDDFQSKPIDRRALLDACRAWIARGSSHAGSSTPARNA
jgi:PAS domain S-box-containing protein